MLVECTYIPFYLLTASDSQQDVYFDIYSALEEAEQAQNKTGDLVNANSVQKMAKLFQDTQDLELELTAMYTSMTHDSEAKFIAAMRENLNVFLSYAKARQKTKAKVGPFLDPQTGDINLDPDYTGQCLSDQYSSVFTPSRPEWSISDMDEFFKVDNSRPTSPSSLTLNSLRMMLSMPAVSCHPLLLLVQMGFQLSVKDLQKGAEEATLHIMEGFPIPGHDSS